MEKGRNYTPPKGCALRSAESPLQGADDFRSLLQSYRGSYTYVIGVHFSKESKDTLEDKMKRLMRDDVKAANF